MKSALENITMNHNMIANIHKITRHPTYFSSLVNAFTIQEIPENTSKIHKIIYMKLQNVLGAHIVIIQQRIRMKASQAINQTGHFFFSLGSVVLLF
jgi:hypothetical protein